MADRTTTTQLPIYDSLQQCAGATGIPVKVLKDAKKAGCPAFHFHRVELGGLLKWIFTESDESGVDWGDELKKWKAKREQRKDEQEDKLIVLRSDVEAAFNRSHAEQTNILVQKLCNELPSKVQGLDAPGVRVICKRTVDEVIEKCQQLEKEWKI